jgi:hypothetical protein
VVLRRKQRGQAAIEFGIIAILFTLILFAIADFGLLLNDWLSVSSGARTLARDASLGMYSCTPTQCGSASVTPDLWNEASSLSVPGVGKDAHFTKPCCDAPNSALVLSVTYYDECTPGTGGGCAKVDWTNTTKDGLDSRYATEGHQGGCATWQSGTPCLHPAAPGKTGNCPNGNPRACPGDSVVLTLTAAGAQVITPLVRPFFAGPNCNSGTSACYVALNSTLTMRFEGHLS